MRYNGSVQSELDTEFLLRLFQVSVALIFTVLAVSFWNFQVGQHARFSEMAENNHQRTLALRAPRGVVFDRDGRVLVENRYSLNISLVRESGSGTSTPPSSCWPSVTRVDPERVRAVVDRNTTVPDYRPLVVIRDASLDQVAAVTARRLELPGVVVEQVPTRYYPSGPLASHLFGHVGEVTDTQLRQSGDPRLRIGSIVGQSGLEQEYNDLLDGTRRRPPCRGEQRGAGGRDPRRGPARRGSTDPAHDRLRRPAGGRGGLSSARATPERRSRSTQSTGEVLALVSLPAYDPE